MSENATRATDTSLRDRQRDLTRRLLIDAFAAVILRDGIHDFSMQAVADEAGCSLRTLYRYFPSREALLTGLDDEVRESTASTFDRLPPSASEDLVQFAQLAPVLMAERREVIKAWAATNLGSDVRDFVSRHVRILVDEAIVRAAPSLSPSEHARAFAGIRLVVTSRSFLALTDHMSAEDAAITIGWIVRMLLADLASGGGPRAE